MRAASRAWRTALALLATSIAAAGLAEAQTLSVCMAEDNPPLSYRAGGEVRGLDLALVRAVADALGRKLEVIPFESKYERESALTHEVNALLSSGVCEMASGFPLMSGDLGAPSRPTARVPDYPGAKRRPLRPWVPLGTLIPSRPYHATAMALVVREPARKAATLAEPGDARIGVVTGTLAGTIVTLYRNGKLRPQIVSLAQNEDLLAQLETGRFDAALVALDRFDAWRLGHPTSIIERAAYTHPLRINIGFVARSEAAALMTAVDKVIGAAAASGELERLSRASGVSWIEPVEPWVSGPIGLSELTRE